MQVPTCPAGCLTRDSFQTQSSPDYSWTVDPASERRNQTAPKVKDRNLELVSLQMLLFFSSFYHHSKHVAALNSNPERGYLVHALGNKLSLAVDAGERAVPRHLLQRVRNISRRRGAAIC